MNKAQMRNEVNALNRGILEMVSLLLDKHMEGVLDEISIEYKRQRKALKQIAEVTTCNVSKNIALSALEKME